MAVPITTQGCECGLKICATHRAIEYALADAERAVWEEAARIVDGQTVLSIAAEQRYREKHGKEELNGVRMSERVEFTLTSHGLTIAQMIRAQAQGQEEVR